ncbi:ABC-three component system protein [Photobacterium leiognathi]|uniref:ABC-three component system protein n=1 Tax=Photobacterium leiognathi TaxID=553611 RepID=UPI00273A1117|nr:ABC-three component system protein [Photobacterium leiognathi]
MSQQEEKYPASAISSWSGFVYQGKVALYHSLKLIHDGDLDFELQLDSSDDFAIYKAGKLHSAHQVKAKISNYRSGYAKALEQSTLIEYDKIKGTSRYFHVSVKLDSTKDHKGVSGETVKFYCYGDKFYCGLGEIEDLTKALIKKICEKKSITVSDNLINFNYCLLSEKISTKAIHNHKLNQVDGLSENKAAYEGRINAEDILNELLDENPYQNREYYAVELKSRLLTYLEERLDQALPTMSDATYKRAYRLCMHIHDTHINELKNLCQMMKPSERFQDIQKSDIRRYTKLIQAISVEPTFNHLPHYLDSENRFYVPTALDVDEREDCESDMNYEMKNNGDLLRLLFEYNHLIASKAEASFTFDTKFTNSDNFDDKLATEKFESNITKSLCISVMTKDDAEGRLNDKATH